MSEQLKSMQDTIDSQHAEICSLNRNVDRLLKENRKLRKRLLRESSVVGFDESGCYVKGRLKWSWIAQTAYLTLVFSGAGRSAKVLEERFGDSLKKMTAVIDRHRAYFAIDSLNNQICLAHLLRNMEYLNDIDKEQT